MQALTTSKFGDGVVLVNTTQANPKDKGDLILSTPHVIETLYFLGLASKKLDSLLRNVAAQTALSFAREQKKMNVWVVGRKGQ